MRSQLWGVAPKRRDLREPEHSRVAHQSICPAVRPYLVKNERTQAKTSPVHWRLTRISGCLRRRFDAVTQGTPRSRGPTGAGDA